MKLKVHGVVLVGLKPEMYFYAGALDYLFRIRLGHDAVVTNAVAPRAYASKHGLGLALDFRTREHFDWVNWRHNEEMVQLYELARKTLDPYGYDTVLEPDSLVERDIVKRFSDQRLDALIEHHDRTKITEKQLETLRRQITPHWHGEFDPKDGEILWGVSD